MTRRQITTLATAFFLSFALCSISWIGLEAFERTRTAERRASESRARSGKLAIASLIMRDLSPHIHWDRLRDEYTQVYRQYPSRRLGQGGQVTPFWVKDAKERRPPETSSPKSSRSGVTNVMDAVQGLHPGSSSVTKKTSGDSALDLAFDSFSQLVAEAKDAQQERQPSGNIDDDSLGLDDDQLAPSATPSERQLITAPSATPSIEGPGATSPSEQPDTSATPSMEGPGATSPSEQPESSLPPKDDSLGIPIPVYEYSSGTNCGDASQTVPCAPNNIRELCSKGGTGKLSTCLEACIPSFCCIHDAPPATNLIAPSCNMEPNCAQYAPCYIAWWKLHDTIGPATLLQLESNDDFYDIEASDISGDVTGVEFLQEMLFHHFDDAAAIIQAGTVNGEFDSDRIFLNPDFWDAESVIGKVNQP